MDLRAFALSMSGSAPGTAAVACPPPVYGNCRECGSLIADAPRRGRPRVFCSAKCRGIWHGGHRHPCEPRVCMLCEESYIPKPKPRPGQAFCSKSCKTAWQNGARPPYSRQIVVGMAWKTVANRKRRQRRAETWDGVTDAQILARDNWRCGICQKPIDKSLRYPHLRSKSIDHIVPVSKGGDDTAANKRAAHLGCNQARGNRGGMDQLAMFG